MMPEMDGYAVLRHIRALEDEAAKNVPIVALTALAFDFLRYSPKQPVESWGCSLDAEISVEQERCTPNGLQQGVGKVRGLLFLE
jgi:CheY-like chemotaxis protein